MKPGDYALAPGDGFYMRAVRLDTCSRYGHARLVTSFDGDTVEALDCGAVPGRVQKGDVIVSVPMTASQSAAIPDLAKSVLGTPYDWTDVFALGLAQWGMDFPRLRAKVGRPDRLFCSQLVDYIIGQAGYQLFDNGRMPQNVSPGDLADLGFRSDWRTEVVK